MGTNWQPKLTDTAAPKYKVKPRLRHAAKFDERCGARTHPDA